MFEAITPVEARSLRRIDTSVFASDKFAFEMVEFAKAYRKPATIDMQAEWERHFVRGLEVICVIIDVAYFLHKLQTCYSCYWRNVRS